jgi:prepilin signal peptidase PulO-like enzyme (type II secretory pathway)
VRDLAAVLVADRRNSVCLELDAGGTMVAIAAALVGVAIGSLLSVLARRASTGLRYPVVEAATGAVCAAMAYLILTR